jgi:hypothetical protein
MSTSNFIFSPKAYVVMTSVCTAVTHVDVNMAQPHGQHESWFRISFGFQDAHMLD